MVCNLAVKFSVVEFDGLGAVDDVLEWEIGVP